MKKILFGMMAAAVLATSCAKELQDVATGDATVTFAVGTPEIATRAYSDGATATVLQYAVYDEAENELTDLTVKNAEIHGSTTVKLQLTTGNTYSVIFWAAAPNAPYTVDFATKTMTVNYNNAVSNDEARDAFFKRHTFTVTGAQTETIELRRPFAQLNIGTADYAASTSAGYTPVKSAVTVKSIYNTLNLWDGAVDGETEVTYNYAEIAENEAFPVAGYQYLAMNYLLVAADKDLVDIEFGYTETDATAAKTRIVGSVPVQRNYRTNIYGNLLTSDVDINVEINPDYNEPAYEADELQKAAAFGGEVTLTEDVVLKNPLEIQANMVLNLGGKTLTGVVTVAEGVQATIAGGKVVNNDKSVSGITSNGNLTLDNVEIESARHALRVESGKVVINGGTYKVAPISNSTLHALNVGDDNTTAEVIIKGGTFTGPKGTMADSGSAVNVRNGSKVVIEGGNFSGGKKNTLSNAGTMTIKGGNFDQNPKAEWIAAGMKAVEKDGRYYVVAEEIDAVAESEQDLKDALANGQDVVLANPFTIDQSESNGYGKTGINMINGGTLDGNGNELGAPGSTGTWDSAINTSGGTIKNIKITEGFRGIFIKKDKNHNEKLYLDNVTIDGTTYTISCDSGNGHGLEAYNSTFNGWTSYAATIGAVKFEDCSFGKGEGYAYCRPYAPTEFVNCDFAAGYKIDPRAAVTFENCTFGGVALTAANLAALVSNTANATVK